MKSRIPWDIVGVVSAGGVLGALARFAIADVWPPKPGGFPWDIFTINVTGCFLIGMLMVAVTEVWPSRRLLRPFLGTGILGGYTTFSTAIVDSQHLLDQKAIGTALAYLGGTAVAALSAVLAGTALARAAIVKSRAAGAETRVGREKRP
jgi:fluoride exporter